MAMLKNKELRTINPRELKTKLEELRKELIKLNVQKSTGTSAKNPKQIKIIKKTIARILTLLQKKYKKLEKKPEGEK
jgi:ribosomal protein L29|tara:strand:+ start:6798 stop:7028 length:231 start_codon:yes stop_codon:yes gene_type:complete